MDNASQSQPSPTSVPSPVTGAERSAAFTLDTSGSVTYYDQTSHHTLSVAWSDLTPFCQGFIRAMFESLPWSNVYCDDCPPDGYPTDKTRCSECPRLHRFDIISPAALERIVRECERATVDFEMFADKLTRASGRKFWSLRQSGASGNFPPLLVSLDSEGKVIVEDQP